MCLAIPVRVKQIVDHESAVVELNGVATRISTVLIEDVSVGDFVILHVGYALSKLDEDEAQKTIAALREAGELD
jgi:hydrogenase expression/formation protein HypC